MKNLLLFLTTLGIFFGLLFFFDRKPFKLTGDFAISESYAKRLAIIANDQVFTSLVRYSPEHLRLVNSLGDELLANIRCSDELIRTNQGVYVLKNVKTSQRHKRTIKNQDFIEFMRNKEKEIPISKKILTAKICENENGDVLVLYSIGRYDSSNVDNSTILQTIHDSTDNESFVQVLPKGKLLNQRTIHITASQKHITCMDIFQLTKKGNLYILCSEEDYKKSNHFLFTLDLSSGSKKLLGKCTNDYSGELITDCD